MENRRSKGTADQAGAIQTLKRVGKYSLSRGFSVVIALYIGIYLCVLAVNFGGFIDAIFNDRVENAVMAEALFGDHTGETYEETSLKLNALREQLRNFYGLDEPFFKRSLQWYWHALTFDWGEENAPDDEGRFYFGTPSTVGQIVLDYLPRSLLLFSTANLFTFFVGIFSAMYVARKPKSWLNKLVTTLTPLFTAPSWVYGIILMILIPVTVINYPKNALISPEIDYTNLEKVTVVFQRIIWPVAATFISMFIQLLFSWRTYFLLSASENYVELATAMGLSPSRIEQKHILRPTLIPVITNFSMLLLSFWQSSLAIELLFDWPGIGYLFIAAIWSLRRNVAIGILITFAYLIAFTVFILDFVYALVDPRVRLFGKKTRTSTAKRTVQRIFKWFSKPKITITRKPGQPHRRSAWAYFRINWRRTALLQGIRQIFRSRAATLSLLVIILLVVSAVIIVIEIPQETAIEYWRHQRDDTWRTPQLAAPTWANFFRREKLPETLYMTLDSEDVQISENVASNSWSKEITFTLDFQAAHLPQDVKLNIVAEYAEKLPLIEISVLAPDGRRLELARFNATSETLYSLSDRIAAEFATANRSYPGSPMVLIFTNPEEDPKTIIPGEYKIQIAATTFEENCDISVELAMLGMVYGIAGTDFTKRDLSIPLLWGLPVALVFGFAGAVLTSIGTMLIAAFGTWYGGLVDTIIQRVTEVNIMIPALPIAMTIYFSVSKSIWVILGVMVLLSIFSSELKNYRAAFLQIKDLPYVEAAQSYGATNLDIIRRYMIPKIYPLLLPRIIFMVPAYVYLEATLAYLGVSGIFIPTWGKMIFEGLSHRNALYWIAQPIILLVLTGTAFTTLGIGLDKILNPSLQNI